MTRYYSIAPRMCLNGWWDLLPVMGSGGAGAGVPAQGWSPGNYLVPSFWTKTADAVRRKGEKYFVERKDLFEKPGALTPDMEFLFDAFGYPNEWCLTRRGWVRRTVDLPPMPPGQRWFLEFEAVEPKPTLYVNGLKICTHIHPSLPMTADVTDALRPGVNEIALFIDDYDRTPDGRVKTPAGTFMIHQYSGIWQDVFLVRRGAVRVEDVTIRTSTRERMIEARWEFVNAGATVRTVEVVPTVHAWDRITREVRPDVALCLPPFSITVPAGGSATHMVQVPWLDAKLWQPETPHLYVLQTVVAGEETQRERFGFREVWIDGVDLMLNGYPMHLFSDWGHKLAPYCLTEAWVRQWFGMIRDANMNHSRLHTHPHPQMILDLADEEGILITDETGIHGGCLAVDSPEFWDAARDHLRRLVKRDKNHPCVVLWSVGNETRWISGATRRVVETMPQLRKLCKELDPTRPAYHEGDSSLWNESGQDIISRHYYKACAGTGWWERDRPLHSGEMSLYHQAGPNNTSHLAGDLAWSSFRATDEAAARDTALIIEAGRALGVCCFGPWNLSCLENLRLDAEWVRLEYRDYTAPGMKPLQVPPHSSEFAFWKPGEKGYTPNWSFAIQKQAFRPFAVVDLSQRSSAFTDAPLCRRLFAINDTQTLVRGVLSGALLEESTGVVAVGAEKEFVIERGRRVEWDVKLHVSALPPGHYRWRVQFIAETGAVLDQWERPFTVARRGCESLPAARIAVLGPGSLREALADLRVNPVYVDSLAALSTSAFDVLILERNTVAAGTTQNRQVQDFCRAGGRVLVMEQAFSLFPALQLEDKPLQTQFFRAPRHPVLSGLTEADLSFWGDSPFSEQGGDALVINRAYRKDDGKHALTILDGEEGGFGYGTLDFAGLIEIREGSGLVLACQLNITAKAGMIPAAAKLLGNLLRRLITFHAPAVKAPVQVDGARLDPAGVADLARQARVGRNVIVHNATPATLAVFSRELGVELRPVVFSDPVYQAVRVTDDPVLSGISNEDTCGVETWTYAWGDRKNLPIGSCFLAPMPGLEPLLETPTESLLRELFVFGGLSEQLRAHTLSRFLYAEKNERAIVLGRVRAGAGQIFFNQFAVSEMGPPRQRLARLANRLAVNLGVMHDGSVLAGDCVPENAALSPGYPESFCLLNIPEEPGLRQRLVAATQFHLEHVGNAPILGEAAWRCNVPCPNGEIHAAGLDLAHPVYAYSRLHSAVQRKDASSNLGVPNPEAFTFLDLDGDGDVDVTVNGHTRDPLALHGKTVTVSDVALEQGCNHVLICWRPASAGSALRWRWRNIDHKAETKLRFE